jgi:hypothetical protein
MLSATSRARHSRVHSSTTVRHLSCLPSAQASKTKSYAQTCFGPVGGIGLGRLDAMLRTRAQTSHSAHVAARSARSLRQVERMYRTCNGRGAASLGSMQSGRRSPPNAPGVTVLSLVRSLDGDSRPSLPREKLEFHLEFGTARTSRYPPIPIRPRGSGSPPCARRRWRQPSLGLNRSRARDGSMGPIST